MSRSTLAPLFWRLRAIARRDFALQVSYQFQLLLHIGSVIFTIITFLYISKLVAGAASLDQFGGSYFEFALVGLMVMSFLNVGLRTLNATVASEQAAGTLEILLSTPTRLGTLLSGALVVPVIQTAIDVAAYLVIGVGWLGVGFSASGLALGLLILVLTFVSFCAFGILSAAFIVLTKRGDPFTLVFSQASSFLAGALFPVSLLPGFLQDAAHLVPAFYGLRAIRLVLLGGGDWGKVWQDIAALVGFGIVLIPAAMWCFGRAVRSARITGTLGTG